MSKKGENIYKRKDGRWEGRYIRHYDTSGKPKYGSVYGKSYCEVKQRLIEKKSSALQNPDFTIKSYITYTIFLPVNLCLPWQSSLKFVIILE